MLSGKKILLGVTGSIAAYKAVLLVRLLQKSGADVQVIVTKDALDFVGAISFQSLTRKPVHSQLTNEDSWNNHVELGLWADAYIIYPITANTIAKLCNGMCDNMITAAYLSTRCPVFLAPAMDLDMWKHPTTQRNIKRLIGDGCRIIPPTTGELASGLVGEGRVDEPESALVFLERYFQSTQSLKGKKILVTAGPTHEAIDPVRFIGNRSSGKMGIAIAEHALASGADVTLILGPASAKVTRTDLKVVKVESAQQMYDAAISIFDQMDAAILSAAVADYRPAEAATQKIKKSSESLQIELVKTPDIAGALGKLKKPNQILIGFALETENGETNALSKLERKNLDGIVLNIATEPGVGFIYDTNKVTFYGKNNIKKEFELKSKTDVAIDIIQWLADLLKNNLA